MRYPDGATFTVDDPYRFWPTLGDLDLHLIGEGRHEQMWCNLGAHIRTHQGVTGTSFVVWAPNARGVRVVGDFNSWDGRLHPMRRLGTSGLWELFLPAVKPGDKYKFEIIDANGQLRLKADPFAFATEVPPGTASVVFQSDYTWNDGQWIQARAARATRCTARSPSTSATSARGGRCRRRTTGPSPTGNWPSSCRPYLEEHGFTHVEFLPVAEHPYAPSWGYQVSAYYAPTARFGTPDDFRLLVDALHEAGIGVLVDWVPAHFPKDDFALARFDGTALYEHADPRQGEHPDWGTLVFNFGRNEVRNFLLANALFWVDEYHIDGLRVDAVASMLYLDYSREEGEWIPNKFGGRENLEAVDFLKEFNTDVLGKYPGVMTIAEESTAWPMVSRPTYVGGLGFAFKWNMGWMHDTLDYFHHEPVHRQYHHHELTFGMLYAFTENFCLPLSHDEVVHGKGSLLQKMPGDRWQQLANLRSLYAWMWAHPGKKLLFMGAEMAQDREWAHDRSLDWHLLDHPSHAGRRQAPQDAQPALQGAPGAVGAGLRVDGLLLDRRQRHRPERPVVPPLPRRPRSTGQAAGLHRQPGARPPGGVPDRRAPGRLVAGGAQHRRHRLLGQRRGQRRAHGRRLRLARPRPVPVPDPAAPGRRLARTRGLTLHWRSFTGIERKGTPVRSAPVVDHPGGVGRGRRFRRACAWSRRPVAAL